MPASWKVRSDSRSSAGVPMHPVPPPSTSVPSGVLLRVALRCPGAPSRRNSHLSRVGVDDVARGLSARCDARRSIDVLSNDLGQRLLRARHLRDHRAVHDRGLAGATACQRSRPRLRNEQCRQVHRPGRLGGDRRSIQFRHPQATLDAIIPAFNYFAGWYVLAALALLFIGIETRGRTIEELDAALTGRAPEPATVKIPAQ